MEKEKQILEEVDKTLRAFDDLPKLDANPFLFTRIQARLSSEGVPDRPYWLRHLKPIALAVIVILNLVTAFHFLGANREDHSQDQLIFSLSRDYNSSQTDLLMDN